jgi:hypothetical protein
MDTSFQQRGEESTQVVPTLPADGVDHVRHGEDLNHGFQFGRCDIWRGTMRKEP